MSKEFCTNVSLLAARPPPISGVLLHLYSKSHWNPHHEKHVRIPTVQVQLAFFPPQIGGLVSLVKTSDTRPCFSPFFADLSANPFLT